VDVSKILVQSGWVVHVDEIRSSTFDPLYIP